MPRGESTFVTVVIPELFRRASLLEAIRKPRALLLKLRLLAEPGVVVADVPALAGVSEAVPGAGSRRVSSRSERGFDAGCQLRAHAGDQGHPGGQLRLQRRGGRGDTPRVGGSGSSDPARGRRGSVPRHRHAFALLSSRLTDDGKTEVIVVMPELVLRGPRRALHNQRALYLKRLLLFEPRVILASVPYQLMR